MTKEELLEFKYTYGYFKIDDLTYGYMTILFFQPPCTYTKVSFDECLEDSVPSMVQTYNALRHHKPYDFFIEAGTEKFYIKISNYSNENLDDSVLFTVKISNWNSGLQYGTELHQEMPVAYLMYVFEKFFSELLHHPDFPFQYPCFSETASPQGIDVEAEFEKKYENMNLSNAKYIKLDKQFMREHITEFTECGETLKNEFITMLTEYKVPDGWTILRESGPETKHDIF